MAAAEKAKAEAEEAVHGAAATAGCPYEVVAIGGRALAVK